MCVCFVEITGCIGHAASVAAAAKPEVVAAQVNKYIQGQEQQTNIILEKKLSTVEIIRSNFPREDDREVVVKLILEGPTVNQNFIF